jgi:hypothetical protein
MSSIKMTLALILLFSILPLGLQAASGPEVGLFVVTDYSYEQGKGKDDPVMGQSLCGTRCNAIATDYLNIVEPGGWRLIKVATGRKLSIPLNNPFMGGHCICVVDEYIVKVDHLNKPDKL